MPRTVLFAIYPSFQLLDAAGPITAFEIATRFVPNAYVLRVAASTEGLVPSSSGVPMPAEKLRGINLARVDTLVVVGGMGVRGAVADKILVAALRRAPRRVRRIASVCSGSMLLATAGLLKDRRATTHWRVAGLLQRSFPSVHVEPDKIYNEDKGVWTSAGISAGIDLTLARQNLQMRMSMRHFTRLTNAHSKKLANHCHALALYFTFYNWVRVHSSLRVTPAMSASLTDKPMSWEDLVAVIDAFDASQAVN